MWLGGFPCYARQWGADHERVKKQERYRGNPAPVLCFRVAKPKRTSGTQLRNAGYMGNRILGLELPGRRKSGKPKERVTSVVGPGMRAAGVTE